MPLSNTLEEGLNQISELIESSKYIYRSFLHYFQSNKSTIFNGISKDKQEFIFYVRATAVGKNFNGCIKLNKEKIFTLRLQISLNGNQP